MLRPDEKQFSPNLLLLKIYNEWKSIDIKLGSVIESLEFSTAKLFEFGKVLHNLP